VKILFGVPTRVQSSFALLVLVLSLVLCGGAYAQTAVRDAGPKMPPNKYATQNDWWKHAVVYEIYPRSFGDSNNDGTGDLNGITEHLDYLQHLGVDAIWLTPMFPSPQVDFGYDVSDYRNVDPQYGTLADMDRLVKEGQKRGIRVILDFVVNHTSDKHKWFEESRKSKENPYRDYYIWRDGRGPGQPPNNWASWFGGSSWKFDPTTNQWYYHYFYAEQPDLNWRNPKVEQAMFDVMRFWFQRGIYGFRLDAVDRLFEDPKLTDNPPQPGVDAYGVPNQEHIHDGNLPEVHTELQKMRKISDQYPGRVLIGETWTETPAELAQYYGPKNNELQMPMYFNMTTVNKLSAEEFREHIDAIEHNSAGGWPVYVFSNHDMSRQVERYTPAGADKDKVAKLLAGMYLTLRGTPIMYYGEELGMENNDPTRREDVKDIIGQRGWPTEKGRDGERTPMQWDASVNAGFNTGAKTWLPVNPDYTKKNAATEMADKNSVLNWYRQLIRLRREDPAIAEGQYVAIDPTDANVLAYLRKTANRTVLVALNMTGVEQQVRLGSHLSAKTAKALAVTGSTNIDLRDFRLEPFGVVVAELK
jgi:alpha-glucosidase